MLIIGGCDGLAAYETLRAHLQTPVAPEDYDLIVTGDRRKTGKRDSCRSCCSGGTARNWANVIRTVAFAFFDWIGRMHCLGYLRLPAAVPNGHIFNKNASKQLSGSAVPGAFHSPVALGQGEIHTGDSHAAAFSNHKE